MPEIHSLQGKTLTGVERKGDEEIHFFLNDGRVLIQYHLQNCCERVAIEDVAGDLSDLVGVPILLAETRTKESGTGDGSDTWTFYTLRTIKGTVDIRWHGSSNGYYSEKVDHMWGSSIETLISRLGKAES